MNTLKLKLSIIIKALLSLLFLYLFSCSSKIKDENQVFNYITYDDVKDWDPATAFSLEVVPMSNIYEPLLWYQNSKFQPGLAESYKKSKDGLEWVFNLQRGVSFHDGSEFNAYSVKFVIERNKTFSKGPSYIWSSVKHVEVLEEYKILIVLSDPTPLDLIVSSQYGAWMYSKNIEKIPPDSLRKGYASGTGPYYLKSWDQNRHIKLKKFDNYWNKDLEKGYFNEIKIKVVSEASTRLQMIKNNIADFATLIPSQIINKEKDTSNITISYQPSWVNHFYLLNSKKYPTNNIWIRRAIASSFNRDILDKHIYKNLGTSAKGLVPSTIPLSSSPDSLIEFDLEKAKAFLKKSKISLDNLKVNLSYVSSSEEYRLTSLMLFDNLRKIGVELDIKPGLWSTNWEKAKNIKTAPNIISMAWWPTYPTPSDWFFSLYKSQKSPLFNLSYYNNSNVDSLIQLAWINESTKPEKAKNIYKQIQEIIINDCIVIPAIDLNLQSVYNKKITGFKNNPAYSTLFFYDLRIKN